MESMDRALEDVAGREERGRRCLVMAQDRVRWQGQAKRPRGVSGPGARMCWIRRRPRHRLSISIMMKSGWRWRMADGEVVDSWSSSGYRIRIPRRYGTGRTAAPR